MKRKTLGFFLSFFLLLLVFGAALMLLCYRYCPQWFWASVLLWLVGEGILCLGFLHTDRHISALLRHALQHLAGDGSHALEQVDIPVMALTEEETVLWYNAACQSSLRLHKAQGEELSRFVNLSLDKVAQNPGMLITLGEQSYQLYLVRHTKKNKTLSLLFFQDVTPLYRVVQQYHRTRPVVLKLLIDSYEEIIKYGRESERGHLLSEIDRILEDYIGRTNGFLLRLSQSKYVAVVERQHFEKMMEERFSILEQVKKLLATDRLPVTLSIGVGSDGETLEENEQSAEQALDMALGRGGDQAAVKLSEGFRFFGGVSQGVEKRTKVKSRIIATVLQDLIQTGSNVLIMGHSWADLDAVGAGYGLSYLCRQMGIPAHMVLREDRCLATTLIRYISRWDKEKWILSPEEAMQHLRKDTLLIVVDTLSADFVESPELYQMCSRVVVIDHHRKNVNYIQNALVFFHEPGASSTCEMVTELSQYFKDVGKLEHYHAEALLGGIMLDTKNFIMKTGIRTFEAAAYLKRAGADTVEVKRLFSGSMDSYRTKAMLVSGAELYRQCAIAVGDEMPDAVRLAAPQAADELLEIDGVACSFVIYKQHDTTYLSARSMGEINVQLIMEQLGGGGHQTMAGAQLKDTDCANAKKMLQSAIDQYMDARQTAAQS